MTELPTVAFLGTGLMGAPMAARMIAAGYPLRVWNRSIAKTAGLSARGAIACESAAEAVRGAGVVCLCLTDARAAEDVLFGQGAAAAAIAPDALVIDFSTIGVSAARTLAERLAQERGADWLDCPVSGGVAGAEAGSLVMFAGGSAAALARAEPLLTHVSARVSAMGGVGAGQAAKLCNQLIVVTNMLAIAEAVALGERLGVDVAKLPAALAGGFADSRPLQLFGARMAAAVDPGPRAGEVRTMAKDADAILRAAGEVDAATPVTAHTRALYGRLLEAGLGGEDLPALIRLYRDGLAG